MQIVRTQANTKGNPRVLFAWQYPNVGDDSETVTLKGGFYLPITAMSFSVTDSLGAEVVALTAVDLDDDDNWLDSDGARRIVIPPFTTGGGSPVGVYTLTVTFTAHPPGGAALPEQTVSYAFRVIDQAHGLVDSYAQIVDLLTAGFPIAAVAPPGGYSFAQASAALVRARRYIDEICGWWFAPEYKTIDVDGRGGSILQLDAPIAGLTSAAFTFTTFTPSDLPVSEGALRVYNRHIRQNLREPDDRQDPRIEFLRVPNVRYPRGQIYGESDLLSQNIGFAESQQNVKLRGVFGYTDFDGSPFGETPLLIRECAMRLAARYIQPLWLQVGGAGPKLSPSGAIASERTLDQSVSYANANFGGSAGGAFMGSFTGDPEIDQILALYMRPPHFGSA